MVWRLMREAGQVLHLTPSGVRWLCDTRRLRCIRTPSGVRLVSARAIRKLLAQRTASPEDKRTGGE